MSLSTFRRGTVGALLLIALFGIGPVDSAIAQESPSVFPVADGYVVDPAGALSPETELALEEELLAYEARTTNQVAVAVVSSLGGRTVEAYATGLFNAWGVGQATANNGVLLVVATEDRKLRIEVGAGLLDELPDAEAASVVEREIVPRLRSGDIEGGVRSGVIGIRRALDDDVATPDGAAGSLPVAVAAPQPRPGFDSLDGDTFFDDGSDGYPDGGLNPFSLLILVIPIGLVGWLITQISGDSDRCPNCSRALSWGGSRGAGVSTDATPAGSHASASGTESALGAVWPVDCSWVRAALMRGRPTTTTTTRGGVALHRTRHGAPHRGVAHPGAVRRRAAGARPLAEDRRGEVAPVARGELTMVAQARVAAAVAEAERLTGLELCVVVCKAGPEATRTQAERAFRRLKLAQRPGVLIMVLPRARKVEMLTSAVARERVTDADCTTAAAAMVEQFKAGDLAAGIEAGLAVIAGCAGEGQDAVGQLEMPDVLEA